MSAVTLKIRQQASISLPNGKTATPAHISISGRSRVSIDSLRHSGCEYYRSHCFALAARENWPSFSCAACPLFEEAFPGRLDRLNIIFEGVSQSSARVVDTPPVTMPTSINVHFGWFPLVDLPMSYDLRICERVKVLRELMPGIPLNIAHFMDESAKTLALASGREQFVSCLQGIISAIEKDDKSPHQMSVPREYSNGNRRIFCTLIRSYVPRIAEVVFMDRDIGEVSA